MIDFSGKIKEITINWRTNKPEITLSVDDEIVLQSFDSLIDNKLSIRLKKFRKKRSLDSNAYAWLLISKIADIIRSSKEEVYVDMLQKYGQPYINNGQVEMISVLDGIDVSKYGIYVKRVGQGHVGDKLFSHYMVLRGSSTYNTKEMSVFIDGVVSDAKELGINTIPIVDLEKMKEKWHI